MPKHDEPGIVSMSIDISRPRSWKASIIFLKNSGSLKTSYSFKLRATTFLFWYSLSIGRRRTRKIWYISSKTWVMVLMLFNVTLFWFIHFSRNFSICTIPWFTSLMSFPYYLQTPQPARVIVSFRTPSKYPSPIYSQFSGSALKNFRGHYVKPKTESIKVKTIKIMVYFILFLNL